MRVGQNPAKFVNKVAQPADLTIAVVSCLPFLSGFYEQGLEVLKACIFSIREHTDRPFDLMLFDNHSCREVRQYLVEACEQGLIQYLMLSDKNIGKIGAWNAMFGAAQGEYIAFADSDIYFRPGWLRASLDLFAVFPNVGMVTARPWRTPQELSTTTFEWGRNQGTLEEGVFQDWQTFHEHAASLGMSEKESHEQHQNGKDFRLSYGGKRGYIGADHFQFLSRRDILQRILPLPSEKPMRGERALDSAINALGLLRLFTTEPHVLHMGNRLPEMLQPTPPARRKTPLQRLLWLPGIRHFLLWAHNRIFRLFFDNVE